MLTNALSQTNEEKFNNKETIFFLFAFLIPYYYIQSINCEFIKSIFSLYFALVPKSIYILKKCFKFLKLSISIVTNKEDNKLYSTI